MCKFQLLYKVKILYYLPEMYMYLCIGLRLIVWCDCLNNGSSGKKMKDENISRVDWL